MKKLNFKTIENGRTEKKLVSFLPESILTEEEKKSLSGGDDSDGCFIAWCSSPDSDKPGNGPFFCPDRGGCIIRGECPSNGVCIIYV